MDKIFDSPWMLRLTALFLAALLFLYVQSEMNTKKDANDSTHADIITDVPLEVYYDDENLLVTGLPATVDVKISGPMSIVNQTKLLKDYKVFVDLNSLLIGEHSVTIQQENFSSKLIVKIDPEFVNVVIEERMTEEFKVEPEMNSRLVGEDYVVDGMIAAPSRVTITGAKSIIERISYVKATISGEAGINASFEQQANVKVLDRDLNKLDVIINPEKVKVKVEINEYSKELPITMIQKGEAPAGVVIEKLSLDPGKVLVYGPKNIVDALTEVKADVDLSKIKDSGSYNITVKLPAGTKKLSQEEIAIHADVTKTVETPEEDVEAEAEAEAEAESTVNEGN